MVKVKMDDGRIWARQFDNLRTIVAILSGGTMGYGLMGEST